MFWTMYKRELVSASRNLKAPTAIIGTNTMLALVAIFAYYLKFTSRGKLGRLVGGSAILDIYTLLVIIEFGLVVVAILLLTVPSIMKERRNHSFELLLSVGVSPFQYLVTKLFANVTLVMSVVFATCPILGIVFYVGGVSVKNMMTTMVILTVICIYMGSIGILCASIYKRNITAIACTYLYGFLIFIGSLLLVSGLYLMKMVRLGIDISTLQSNVSIGNIVLLLLANPLYCFLHSINQQLGTMEELFRYANFIDSCNRGIRENWVFYSCICQIVISVLLVSYSARKLKGKSYIKRAIFE